MRHSFRAKLWRWKGDAPASWVFATLPADIAFAIKTESVEQRRAWGSVKVSARIGATTWTTSLFPQKDSGSYLLPVKAAVRKAEGLADNDEVEITIDLV